MEGRRALFVLLLICTATVAHAVALPPEAPVRSSANSTSSSDGHIVSGESGLMATVAGEAATAADAAEAATAAAAAPAAAAVHSSSLDQAAALAQQQLLDDDEGKAPSSSSSSLPPLPSSSPSPCPPGYNPAPFGAPLCVKRWYRRQDTCFDAPACPPPYTATDAPPRCLDAKVTSVIAGLLALRRAGIALPASVQPPLDRAAQQASPSPAAAVTTALLAVHSSGSVGSVGGGGSSSSVGSRGSSSSTINGGSFSKTPGRSSRIAVNDDEGEGGAIDDADDDDADTAPQAPPIQLAREAFAAHAAAALGPLARGALLGPSRADALKLADYGAKLTAFDWMSMPNFNRLYEAVNRAVRAVPAPIVSASRAVAPACLGRCCHAEVVVDTAFAWPAGNKKLLGAPRRAAA